MAKVQLKNGEEKWILVHIEVQSSEETEFPERMFQYFYRIYDRHKEKIVAMAVHTSPVRPRQQLHFEYDYFGTVLNYSYTNCRVEDYPEEALERSEKIFSKVLLAAKALHQTKGKEHQRYLFKGKLMRELVRNKKYSRTAVQATLHFIDYLLQLPEAYTKQLSEEIRPLIRKEKKLMELYNKENASPTILNTFDLEWERGIRQGLEQGMELKQKEIAKKLVIEQVPLETIIAATGLTADEVKDIQKTMN